MSENSTHKKKSKKTAKKRKRTHKKAPRKDENYNTILSSIISDECLSDTDLELLPEDIKNDGYEEDIKTPAKKRRKKNKNKRKQLDSIIKKEKKEPKIVNVEDSKDTNSSKDVQIARECIDYFTSLDEEKDSKHTKIYDQVIKKAKRFLATIKKKSDAIEKLPDSLEECEPLFLDSNSKSEINESSNSNSTAMDSSLDTPDKNEFCYDADYKISKSSSEGADDRLLSNIKELNKWRPTAPDTHVIPTCGPRCKDLKEFIVELDKLKKSKGKTQTDVMHADDSNSSSIQSAIPGPEQKNWCSDKLSDYYDRYMINKKKYLDSVYEQSTDENCSKHVSPIINREYVNKMLCKPVRPYFSICQMKGDCETRKLNHPSGSFTGMVFVYPERYDQIMKTGKSYNKEGLCYLCILSHYTNCWADNNASHNAKKIELPFQFEHSKPGHYVKDCMIQQFMGYTDGITVPFRQFVTSDYIPITTEMLLPNGIKKEVPAFIEKSELVFRSSSRDLEIPKVDPYTFYVVDIKPITTKSLLRSIMNKTLSKNSLKDIMKTYLSSDFIDKHFFYLITGEDLTLTFKGENQNMVDQIFGIPQVIRKRRRGVNVSLNHNSTKFVYDRPFDGCPYDFVFSDEIKTTEDRLEDLSQLFGYQQSNSEGATIYRYPYVALYECDLYLDMRRDDPEIIEDINERDDEFQQQYFKNLRENYVVGYNLEEYRKYHALHLRINVTISLLEYIANTVGLTYTECIEISDYEKNPIHQNNMGKETLKDFNSKRKNFSKLDSVFSQLFNKLNLFLKGHLAILEFFSKTGPLTDEEMKVVPKTKTYVPEEIDEYRSFSEIYEPNIPEHYEKIDETHCESKAILCEKKAPGNVIIDFYKEKCGKDTDICFCDFEITRSFIQSIPVDEIPIIYESSHGFPHWNVSEIVINEKIVTYAESGKYILSEEYETKTYSLKELFNDKEIIGRVSIFVTLLWRIHNAYSCIQTLSTHIEEAKNDIKKLKHDKNNKKKDLKQSIDEYTEIIYNIRLFASTHLELAQYICDNKIYLDEYLEKCNVESWGNGVTSQYQINYPDDIRFVHEGDQFDMSRYYSYVNFISNNRTEKYTWYYLLAKTMPRCCQSRKWINKQINACKSNKSYSNWVIMCLRISLTGSYRKCTKWPDFKKLLFINKSIKHMMIDDEYFYEFQENNENIVMNSIRENMFYCMKFNPSLLKITRKYFPKWDRFERLIHKKMDFVRNLINNNKSLKQINNTIKDIFSGIRFVFRRNPSDFIRYILSIYKEINTRFDKSKKKNAKANSTSNDSTGDEPASEYLDFCSSMLFSNEECIFNSKGRPSKLPESRIELIDDFVSRMDPTEDINLKDLEYIGVSKMCINLIECAYILFLKDEQNKSVITVIERMKLDDYELSYYFFLSYRIHSSLIVMQTDYDIRKKQEQGIRSKYLLKDNEEIPDASGAIVFTNCCQTIKTFTVQKDGRKYFGHEKIHYDENRQAYTCVGKKNKNNSKKRRRSQMMGSSRGSRSISVNNRRSKNGKDTKNRYEKKCNETEVIPIPGIGNIVEFDAMKEKPYPISHTICPNPNCGNVTEFNISMFGPNGFTCNKCDSYERIQLQMPLCDGCKVVRRTTRSWTTVYLVDDGPYGTYQMKRFNFCSTCNRKCLGNVNTSKQEQYDTEMRNMSYNRLDKYEEVYDDKGLEMAMAYTSVSYRLQPITFTECKALMGSAIETPTDVEKQLWKSWTRPSELK